MLIASVWIVGLALIAVVWVGVDQLGRAINDAAMLAHADAERTISSVKWLNFCR